MSLDSRFQTFQLLRQSIKTELKWGNPGPLRDAVALALLPVAESGEVDFLALKKTAETLKQNHHKLYFLRSSMRYAIAASLLADGIEPTMFARTLGEGRQQWKDLKLRRASPYEGASLMALYFAADGLIDSGSLATLKSTFDYLNKEYFWHVGSYTLPALTLALQYDGSAATTGTMIFRELQERKFPSRYRMSTSLIASIAGKSPQETAGWLTAAYQALKHRRMSTAAQRTTGLALGLLTDVSPEEFADEIDRIRQYFKKGVFSSSNAGALAMNFVNMNNVIDMTARPGGEDLSGFAAIMSAIQAYIAMQEQAALIAAVASGAAVAAAS